MIDTHTHTQMHSDNVLTLFEIGRSEMFENRCCCFVWFFCMHFLLQMRFLSCRKIQTYRQRCNQLSTAVGLGYNIPAVVAADDRCLLITFYTDTVTTLPQTDRQTCGVILVLNIANYRKKIYSSMTSKECGAEFS